MEDVVRIARRENNTKRTYLVVNRLQGKHIPVSPKAALTYFGKLAEKVREAYSGETLLFIGFAETATAIGSMLAIEYDSLYLQTTREEISGADYLYFSEDHSHAVSQKLVLEDLDYAMEQVERIVFVEDEITTGNTILHAVSAIKRHHPKPVKFSVASLLNGMDKDALERFAEDSIDVIYLDKTTPFAYPEIAGQAKGDGEYNLLVRGKSEKKDRELSFSCMEIEGGINARRLTNGRQYKEACEELWKSIKQKRGEQNTEKDGLPVHQQILVLGTEEFMFPALYAAKKMEEAGLSVNFHATTRSPIVVSKEPDYPLFHRFELISLYEESRTTFVYNLRAYDEVWIITDASLPSFQGIQSLISALSQSGNQNICLVKWKV